MPNSRPMPLREPDPYPRYLARELTRAALTPFAKASYRARSLFSERVPEHGGALLLPNHTGYLDPFALSLACPRPIRFVMTDEWMEKKLAGPFARLFDVIPISQARAKDALRTIGQALDEGTVVGFFPEGQLGRSGHPAEPMRGFEMLARRHQVPVLPVWLDGMWDSMFSFHGHRFLQKWPHEIRPTLRIAFGKDLQQGKPSLDRLWAGWRRAQVRALEDSLVDDPPANLVRKRLRLIGETPAGFTRSESPEQLEQLVANARQLAGTDFLERRSRILLEWNPARPECHVLLLLARILKIEIALVGEGESREKIEEMARRHRPDTIILLDGSKRPIPPRLSGVLLRSLETDLDAATSLTESDLHPSWVAQGRVITFSGPHPEAEDVRHQPGWIAGSPGRILNGFEIEPDPEGLKLSGPALFGDDLLLNGYELDSAGFLQKQPR